MGERESVEVLDWHHRLCMMHDVAAGGCKAEGMPEGLFGLGHLWRR